jgi:processive 1,2-diacylglycerol beta-glucosyltransferase
MRQASNTLSRAVAGAGPSHMNVLIISASMGAGHDGAARELQTRLLADGHEADVKDYLAAFPLGLGRVVRLTYQWELRLAPWTYDATYFLWYLLPFMAAPLVTLLAMLTRRRIAAWVKETGADTVVSTYPLASLTLGRMRRRGLLDAPVSTFITDFAVHPLWAAPGVDLHLAVHPRAAASAHDQTGAPASAPGPLVPERFTTALPARAAARAHLGIEDGAKVVLLVAGSWGVGAVRRTFDDVLHCDGWLPLAVCGRNERLRRRLSSRHRGWVFGWTDEMPILMAAADVLVENAGGLTCMEAFAAGLPVVSYRPIAGHGRGNAREMAAAGVAARAHPSDLHSMLDATLGFEGERRRRAGRAMFAADAADEVVALAERGAAADANIIAVRHARWRRPAVAAAAAVASLALGVGLASAGAGIAAAHGVAVAHPPKHATAVYLAVRLGPQVSSDPQLPAALAAAGVTAVVSGQLAAADPHFVAEIAAAGCDMANGGWGSHHGVEWTWAHADVQRSSHEIDEATGTKVRTFAPGAHIDGFSLASARLDNQRVVLTRELVPVTGQLPFLRPGRVYVIDARLLPAYEVISVLSEIDALRASGQQISPLSSLTG